MGVIRNKIKIEDLEKQGGSEIETRLSHLEDEYTNLVSYKEDETAIGEWVDGKTLYRRVIEFNVSQPITNIILPIDFNNIDYFNYNIVCNTDNYIVKDYANTNDDYLRSYVYKQTNTFVVQSATYYYGKVSLIINYTKKAE